MLTISKALWPTEPVYPFDICVQAILPRIHVLVMSSNKLINLLENIGGDPANLSNGRYAL